MDKVFLTSLVNAPEGTIMYVSQVQGQPLLAHNPPLIEINPSIVDPTDGTKVACRATAAAKDWLAANNGAAPAATEAKVTGNYALITGAVLPPANKRGNPSGSGAPTKYPFADMEVGAMFFSANAEHKNKDAVKGLSSTVSMHNDKYSEQNVKDGQPEFKTVTRAVRDPVTKKAKLGDDGKKVTETVQLPVKKYNRKFTIRPVTGGNNYGNWTAPADGALIARIL